MAFKKGMSVFWSLYMFFFAVPFPMFLYYSINYSGGGQRHVGSLSSPYLALAYLALAVVCWCWLFFRYFRQWIVSPIREERQLAALLKTGVPREATVVTSEAKGKPVDGYPQLAVTLRFDNLSGTPIQETLPVVDMRPGLHRFDTGKPVRLRINQDLAKTPVIVMDGSEFQPDRRRQLLIGLGWFLLLAVVAAYFTFSYRYENQGTGWRFLTFFHPLLVCPITLLALRWLVNGGLGKLLLSNTDAIRLKYAGHRAEARLLDARQTGTYINEQPQVRFELEYEDARGIVHRTSFKKIVDLLEMDITRAKTIPIFYLADQPQTVAFATDLEDTT